MYKVSTAYNIRARPSLKSIRASPHAHEHHLGHGGRDGFLRYWANVLQVHNVINDETCLAGPQPEQASASQG